MGGGNPIYNNKSGVLGTGIGANQEKNKIKGFELTAGQRLMWDQQMSRQEAIAKGEAPSIAQMQLNQANDQAMKNSLAMAASQRGASNPALAFRQAQIGNQQMGLENAQAGAIMAEQERRQAEQLIAASLAAKQGVAFQQAQSNQGFQLQAQKNQADFISNLGGSAAKAGGGGGANSDEKLKENIKPSSADASKVIEEFLGALKSYTYEYKDKANNGRENPDGKVTSVMAQDLEKTPTGKKAVKEGPDGKEVDYAQLMAPMLASMAELNKRLKKLEK